MEMELLEAVVSWWIAHGAWIWAVKVLVAVPLGTWLAWRWARSRGGLWAEPVRSTYIILGAAGLVDSALGGLSLLPLHVLTLARPWIDDVIADSVSAADIALSGLSVAVLLAGFAILMSIWRGMLPTGAQLTAPIRVVAGLVLGLASLSWTSRLMDPLWRVTMAEWLTAPAETPFDAYLDRFRADPSQIDAWARMAWQIDFVVWNEISQLVVAALALVAGYRIVSRLTDGNMLAGSQSVVRSMLARSNSAESPDTLSPDPTASSEGPSPYQNRPVPLWVSVAWTLPMAGLVLSGLTYALVLVTIPVTNGLLRLSRTGSGLGEFQPVASWAIWTTGSLLLLLVSLGISVRAFPRPALAWLDRPQRLTGAVVLGPAVLLGTWALTDIGVGAFWGPREREWAMQGLMAVGLDQLLLAHPAQLMVVGLIAAFALWALFVFRP